MSDRTPFLATIARNPADMGPRLVYADWLEERGDVRGEFIRSSIELSLWGSSERPRAYGNWNIDCRNLPDWKGTDDSCTIPPNPWRKHCEYHELRFRCAALLAEHRKVWTMAGLPEEWHCEVRKDCIVSPLGEAYWPSIATIIVDFARGFPEILTCRFEEWQRHYQTLVDAMPVREVRLTTPVDPKWLLASSAKHNNIGWDFHAAWALAHALPMLAAEFPGHDRQRPIRYTLLQQDQPEQTEFDYHIEVHVGGIP